MKPLKCFLRCLELSLGKTKSSNVPRSERNLIVLQIKSPVADREAQVTVFLFIVDYFSKGSKTKGGAVIKYCCCFLQAITNGILKSVRHRVVVNATQPRYSTVYFYGIDNTIPLTVPPELVTEDRPLLYKPFTVNEYRKWIISNAIPLHSYKHLQINPE